MLDIVTSKRTANKPRTAHKPHATQPVAVTENPDALLRINTVAGLAGIGISTVYHLARHDASFPKLIKHGTRCTRIRAGDLTAWLKARAAT